MTPQKIALLTDSCADLSPQMAEENQIYVVPLRILCADGEYRDSVDIHAADIYARLRSGELPQTSLPAAQDITGAFDRIAADGYDAVIALMLSGGLSGTYNMVRLLAEERTDLTIRVYDSVSGSLGTGMMVLQLAEDIRLGMDWDTLTERRVPWLIRNTFPFFSVDNQASHHLCRRRAAPVHRQGPGPEPGDPQAHRAGGGPPQRRGPVQPGGSQRRRPGRDGDSEREAHRRPSQL